MITDEQARMIYELHRERGYGLDTFPATEPDDSLTLAELTTAGMVVQVEPGSMRLTHKALEAYDGWVQRRWSG